MKIWNTRGLQLRHTLKGHEHWVTDVCWAPDGSLLASAADDSIRLWDPTTGRLLQQITGHEGRVKCLTFSSDGRLLASNGEDNTVRLWRSDDWRQVCSFEELAIREVNPESNLAFHPTLPVLATLGEMSRVIHLWSVDLDYLLERQNARQEVSYRGAKVVLVGASSTGKTCLARALVGLPFVPQESTHGMKVWSFHAETVVVPDSPPVMQETFLWDLAGQHDYQLVHQLFLDQSSVAIVMFDPTEPSETIPAVQHWVGALRRAAAEDCPRLLVSGRIDRGTVSLSNDELAALLSRLEFDDYLATSAKTGEGVEELRRMLHTMIPWDSVPLTQSPRLWHDVKSFVVARRSDKDPLTRTADLKLAFGLSHPDTSVSERAFDTVIAHLQAQGLVWRLSFGNLLLLRPELLNDYGSAVVLAARNHPRGLGCVLERDVLDVRIDLSSVERLQDRHAERSLLYAVVERFLEREIAHREGEYLVFPSKLNLPEPATTDTHPNETLYHFDGSAEEVYATLIVKLVYGGTFGLVDAWRHGARFHDAMGHDCGVRIEPRHNTRHLISIWFDTSVSVDSKLLLSRFVYDYLIRKAVEGSVERERVFRCPACGEDVSNRRAIIARRSRGEATIVCQFCECAVPIDDEVERRFSELELATHVQELEATIHENRDREVGTTTAEAKQSIRQFDVFLAYHSADEATVEQIALALRRRGINPWFAKWCVPPGRLFQREIERVLATIGSVAVFLGPHGVGPWEDLELQAAVRAFVGRGASVIPVRLPGADAGTEIPGFLSGFRFVVLRPRGDEEAVDELVWGITGSDPRRQKEVPDQPP